MNCRTSRAVPIATICLALASACSGSASGNPATGDSSSADVAGNAGGSAGSAGATVTYAADIQPILMADCSPCHSTLNSGGHDAASSYTDAVRVASRMVQQISSGNMPLAGHGNQGCGRGKPGDPGCVTQADLALIESWIKAGTPE